MKENPDKTVDDFPMPSFVGSNSVNNTTAPSPTHTTVPAPAPAPAHRSPSSVSGVLGRPSSLAELDALIVITCRTNIYLEYSIFVVFRMFYAADMCWQADETPCTVLYLIKGQKVDVGKGVITKPLELTFHDQPMPGGHFRVNLSSVKSGHEDLPPTVRHVGEDDEALPRIGSCMGWRCNGRRIFFMWSRPRAHQ